MTALHLHTSTQHDRHRTVELVGPLTGGSGSTVREHLASVPHPGPGVSVDLDLRCCTDIDLDGLFTLATLRDDLSQRGVDLRLVQVPPLIERFLRQHNFDHLIAQHDTTPATTHHPPSRKAVPLTYQASEADPEAPETDVLDQHIPAGPDTDELADTPPVPMPAEAEPADVLDQHTPVPLDDDENEAAPGASWLKPRRP